MDPAVIYYQRWKKYSDNDPLQQSKHTQLQIRDAFAFRIKNKNKKEEEYSLFI